MPTAHESVSDKTTTPGGPPYSWLRPARDIAGLTLLAVLTVWAGQRVLPADKMFPDFVCFWASGKLLAAGESPYDVKAQIRVQQEYGWDTEKDGAGILAFLPYYYPPWVGLLCVLLVPLGFAGAKLAWFFLNVELIFLGGYLLRDAIPGVPRWMPMFLASVLLFTLASVLLAQTVSLIFFLMALAWKLLDRKQDWLAGGVLVWLTHKPQLSVILILAVLLWSARQHRWGVVWGFCTTLALMSAASALVVPTWPVQMLNATRETPPPTKHFPWIGNSWLLVLQTLGLDGWGLWLLYVAVALPFLVLVMRAAVDRSCPLLHLFSLSILAVFFVAPYARHYDFPILVIPFVVILGRRLPPLVGSGLILLLVLAPYAQLAWLQHLKTQEVPPGKFLLEATYFWVPVLVATAWFLSTRTSAPREQLTIGPAAAAG
jgi:hypothetical protein